MKEPFANAWNLKKISFAAAIHLWLLTASQAVDLNFSPQIPLADDLPHSFNFKYEDLNGDGKKDIIVSEGTAPRFFWFERKPTIEPQFIRHLVETPFGYGDDFSVGDLDGDGDLDIAANGIHSENGGQVILWHENDGLRQPTFTTHVIEPNNRYGRHNLIVDINGDGHLDVVSSSAALDAIRWHRNDTTANPEFETRLVSNQIAGDQQMHLDAVDLDGDGDMDLLSATDEDRQIAWHENSGGSAPSFTTHVIDVRESIAWWATHADLDSDGDQDVITCSFRPGQFYWYENTGGPELEFIPHLISDALESPSRAYPVDLDLDTDIDIIVIDSGTDSHYFFENVTSDSTEFLPQFLHRDYRPVDLVPTDFDEDGDLDLLSLHRGDPNLFWYQNQSQAGTPNPQISPLDGFASLGFEDGPFDPSQMTYVIDNPSSDTTLSWTVSNSEPWLRLDRTFGNIPPKTSDTLTVSINSVAETLNSGTYRDEIFFADADADVVIATREVRLTVKSIILAFFGGRRSVGNNPSRVFTFFHEDLNGDGRKDVVIMHGNDDELYWYERTDSQRIEFVRHFVPLPLRHGGRFSVGDVDGDDDLDICANGIDPLNSDHQVVVWYENDGSDPPEFTSHVIDNNHRYGRGNWIADLDNDGDLDIVAASASEDAIKWYENDGSTDPTFTERLVSAEVKGDQAFTVDVGDLDDDGDLDILSASDQDGKIAWHENSGQSVPMFSTHVIAQWDRAAWWAKAADMDNDGDLDAVACYHGWREKPGIVEWYENDGASQPTFSGHVIDNTLISPFRLTPVDLDRDDDTDLFVGDGNNNLIMYYENTGEPNPEFISNHFDTHPGNFGFVVEDLDLDSDYDLLVLRRGGFSIYDQTPVRIIEPNGRERLKDESQVGIEWRSVRRMTGTGVRFELWNDGGRLIDLGYGWNPEGRDTTDIYLPLLPAGEDYRIRLYSTLKPEFWDESDEPFTIRGNVVRLIRPNGGEEWQAGSQEYIHWKTNPQIAGSAVRFELRNSGGMVADLGEDWDPYGEDVLEIIVPNVPTGDDYFLRARSVWNSDYFDDTDGKFTVINSDEIDTSVEEVIWVLYE